MKVLVGYSRVESQLYSFNSLAHNAGFSLMRVLFARNEQRTEIELSEVNSLGANMRELQCKWAG